MTFARHIVEGIYSNAECARKAGYAKNIANVQASKLLNGIEYPHVLEYVKELIFCEGKDVVGAVSYHSFTHLALQHARVVSAPIVNRSNSRRPAAGRNMVLSSVHNTIIKTSVNYTSKTVQCP